MDQILVCSNKIPSITAIRNSFIKKYMLDANGSYVKVYLYLSMCIQSGNLDFSISSLADLMENTEKDIIRALQYWEKKGLLKITWHESRKYIVGIEFLDPDDLAGEDFTEREVSRQLAQTQETAQEEAAAQIAAAAEPEDKSALEKKEALNKREEAAASPENIPFAITPEQTSLMAENSDFIWICQIVETFLNRPIKPAEAQLLIYLFDTLHFSKDLILHLYDYCISLGKSNVNYIQTVALSWAENHVTTPEEAEKLTADYSNTHTAISKALGLNRALAGIECQYVERWHKEWGMDLAVILEACNRTMLSIQKPDFKYIEGILKNWHKEEVHTLQDVARCDKQFAQKRTEKEPPASGKNYRNSSSQKKNQFQAFPQRNVPEEKMNQLERLLLSE